MIDLAWAAGLFEGEGCITTQDKGRKGYVLPSLSMRQTDEDVIRHFASVVGMGNVSGPKIIEGRKPIWSWGVTGERAIGILMAFRPFLGQRRLERAEEIIAAYLEYNSNRIMHLRARQEAA